MFLTIKHLTSHIGKTNIQSVAWVNYVRFGAKFGWNSAFLELGAARDELNTVNREKRKISAQDEYAKWTKLNRRVDKLTADIKKLEETISEDKSKVDKIVGILLTFTTSIPIWFSRFWFRKQVLFYLPKGVLPHSVEWIMALPFFKTGAVGLTIWMTGINKVLSALILLASFPFEKEVLRPEEPKIPQSEAKQVNEKVSEEKVGEKKVTEEKVTEEKI